MTEPPVEPHPLVLELAAIRRRCGVPRHKASLRAGLGQSSAGRWERGDNIPTLAAFDAYARVLGYRLALVPLQETDG